MREGDTGVEVIVTSVTASLLGNFLWCDQGVRRGFPLQDAP